MKQHYSYQEIKASLTQHKLTRCSLWVRLWVRKASFPVTYLFINTGWTANMVSVLSWIVAGAAAIFLSVNSFGWMLAGVILTNFWLVLDCVDGNIARCRKVKTFMGDFFDAAAGYAPFSLTTIGLGMAAYHTSFLVPEEYRYLLILIGGLGGTCNMYMRLVHQKYQNCYFAAEKILGELDEITLEDTEDKRSFAYIREVIDNNFGVAGLFMPWLFVALFTNTFDIMVCCYAAYYVLSFLAVSVLYCRNASRFEEQAQEKVRKNHITV